MKRILIIFLVLFPALTLFSREKEGTETEAAGDTRVLVQKVEPQDFKEYRHIKGKIAPSRPGDHSLMKTDLSPGEARQLSGAGEIDISFEGVEGRFSWKLSRGGSVILIANENSRLAPGMEAQIRVLKKIHKNALTVGVENIQGDQKGSFVFVVARGGKYAQKTYLTCGPFADGQTLVHAGLAAGDEVVVSRVVSREGQTRLEPFRSWKDREKIVVMERNPITGGYGEKNKISTPAAKPGKRTKVPRYSASGNTAIGKKLELELSLGGALAKPAELGLRADGIHHLVDQYTGLYGVEATAEGEFKENFTLFPVNLSVNYRLSPRLYVKGGVEYAFGSNGGEKSYQFTRDGLTENHLYSLEDEISYLMPFVGLETRFSSFALYANVGLTLAALTHTYGFDYSEEGYSHHIDEVIEGSGKGIGFILGGKYMLRVGGKAKVLIKLEYLFGKINSLTGDKTRSGSNSLGETFSKATSGALYTLEMDPYGQGWCPYWDLYDSPPENSWVRDVRELSLNLSCIRVMIGLAF